MKAITEHVGQKRYLRLTDFSVHEEIKTVLWVEDTV